MCHTCVPVVLVDYKAIMGWQVATIYCFVMCHTCVQWEMHWYKNITLRIRHYVNRTGESLQIDYSVYKVEIIKWIILHISYLITKLFILWKAIEGGASRLATTYTAYNHDFTLNIVVAARASESTSSTLGLPQIW